LTLKRLERNKMGRNVNTKETRLDEKIDAFCQSSTQLLTDIHERCSKPSKKSKRGRKRKKLSVDLDAGADIEAVDWDKELV
jgi:hypothetical protein